MHPTSTEIIVLFIVISSVLLLILSAFIIVVVLKYQQKQNAYKMEINILKTAHQNAMLLSQVEIQEQAFQNIAREIHDNVGQKLALAKLQILGIQNDNTLNKTESVNIISNAMDDLRNLSRSLSSDILLGNGIIEAIRNEVKQLLKTHIFKINFDVKGEPIFLESQRELILFRIIQEGLHNIYKHANAKKVDIILEYTNEEVSVQIQDDGIGFRKGFSKGQGLNNIEARARLLGGTFEIRKGQLSGISLIVSIPTNENITNS